MDRRKILQVKPVEIPAPRHFWSAIKSLQTQGNVRLLVSIRRGQKEPCSSDMDIKTSPHLLLLLLGVLAFVQRTQGLRCIKCSDRVCDPLKSVNCKWGTQKDVCNCCTVCAKGLGEVCGGPWFHRGRCGRGLRCLRDDTDFNSEGVCVRGGKTKVSFH
ncbi:single insulin-like growth factor-binding domain protein-1 isoform X2 [Oratosquilla oratoria]|uniref:single insulin-like growth factor-binding domain protein-1 isoform X2 n=2 Tax=Oratosquilla oratoria TaxID=337810 RepID=UPI003F768B0A